MKWLAFSSLAAVAATGTTFFLKPANAPADQNAPDVVQTGPFREKITEGNPDQDAAMLKRTVYPNPCVDMAHKLGIEIDDVEPKVIKADKRTMESYGETVCWIGPDGVVESINRMNREAKRPRDTIRYETEEQVAKYARAVLDKIDAPKDWKGRFNMAGPWLKGQAVLHYMLEPQAYGKPTYGYGGQETVILNRHTGEVVGYNSNPRLIPDVPKVKISEEQAVAIANKHLTVKGDNIITKTQELYFSPTEQEANEAGLKMLEAKRLRYCWVVRRVEKIVNPDGHEVFPMVEMIAIDAETGEPLTKAVKPIRAAFKQEVRLSNGG